MMRSSSSSTSGPKEHGPAYANAHIPDFLALPFTVLPNGPSDNVADSPVQVIHCGANVTAEAFRQGRLSIQQPLLIRDTPESIGMRVPPPNFTIRDVAERVGAEYPLHVLDVELQTELEGWTLGDMVEYFEDEERRRWNEGTAYKTTASTGRRPRRTSAQAVTKKPHVLNQLSLEVSQTAMGPPFLQSPQFVRDMDWIDVCWPQTWRRKDIYPRVQYYCLTSAAGSWTDFHVDFGGTSVWYHVLSGAKEFCLLPPTSTNLREYQKWLCSKHQEVTFLPDKLPADANIIRIRLRAQETMIIPSGWIHAVYTPEDSLVLGGNFLHSLAIENQLKAHQIEQASHVTDDMLFPYYRQLHIGVVDHHYSELLNRIESTIVLKEKEAFLKLLDQVEVWVYQDNGKGKTRSNGTAGEQPNVQKMAREVAKKHGFTSFGALLDDFRRKISPTDQCAPTRIRICVNPKEEKSPLALTATSMPAKIVVPPKPKREDAESFVSYEEEWLPSPAASKSSSLVSKSPSAVASRKRVGTESSGKVNGKRRMFTSRQRLAKKL